MSQHPDTPATTIKHSLNGCVGELRLSNPEKHNALPQNCWEAIPSAVETLVRDGARIIVVSGEGASFCAGADISEFDVVRKNAQTAQVYEATNSAAFASIRKVTIPTIAKIRGYCLGGGFGLAAACDLRFASDDAVFGVPAAKLGLAYPVDAMVDIVHAVGEQAAKEMLFTARQFTAAEISQFGFLSRIVGGNELDEMVGTTAQEIAELAPLTHRASKAAIAGMQMGDTAFAEQLGNETFSSQDYREGRAAFREKRSAKFIGQ